MEGAALRDWLESVGVTMKKLKERAAASLQLALGFWWDSISRTRTLEERKLNAYVAQLREFAQRKTLSLREMQQVGGRMQRAAMTLPKGAMCFLAALFALMRGLSFSWQKRRTSRALRADFRVVADLLQMNCGRGFFAFDHMERAPAVYTDASKEARYAGGGYMSTCGRYRWWTYGSAAKRQPIDFLEGDAVLLAAIDLAAHWRGKIVPFYIDNRSFQMSAVKGWSKAARLFIQLRSLFVIALRYEVVFEFHWISTHDNIFADALSRQGGEPLFLQFVRRDKPLMPGCKLVRHASSGAVRQFGKEYSSDYTGDGPSVNVDWTAVEVRPSPIAGRGLFARRHIPTGTPVARVLIPGWMLFHEAYQYVLDCGLPLDSMLHDGGRVCMDLAWWRPDEEPMWYFMNHAQSTIANVKMLIGNRAAAAAEHVLVWYAKRPIDVDDEIRFDYGVVPEAWKGDAVKLEHAHTNVSEHHVVRGKRRRTPGGQGGSSRKGARCHGRAFSSDEDGDGPPARGGASTAMSIAYTRASIFVGLPLQALASRVDEIMDNRLSGSSHASIQAALGHWRVVCSRHRWPEVIASDDPSRGGKLATFMIYCIDETDLAGTSILNYTWALRSYMKFCRQLDPVLGIPEWDDWAQAVQVTAWVQSEPRRMVPLDLVRRSILHVQSTSLVNTLVSVQAVVLMLVLLFTFARSETPCPKSLEGFDLDQHLAVEDVRVESNPWRVRVRLKRIKQDQRQERPEARGDGDWVVIGDTPDDPVFSLRVWLQRLFALHGGRRADAQPFFVAPADRHLPLTYQSAMRHVRLLWTSVSSGEEAAKYGLHSLRVTGYTLARRGAGEALAVAQGGWHSDVHQRYDRFSIQQVVALPAAMLRVEATEEEHTAAAAAAAVVLPQAAAPADVDAPPQAPARRLPASPRASPPRKRTRGHAPQQSAAAPAATAEPARPTRLTPANCVGRHVMCPREMWPSWRCNEHGGHGWEAVVERLSHDRKTVLVRFVARSTRTRQWEPMWLQLAALRPI